MNIAKNCDLLQDIFRTDRVRIAHDKITALEHELTKAKEKCDYDKAAAIENRLRRLRASATYTIYG